MHKFIFYARKSNYKTTCRLDCNIQNLNYFLFHWILHKLSKIIIIIITIEDCEENLSVHEHGSMHKFIFYTRKSNYKTTCGLDCNIQNLKHA